jgi:small subunit ribosomal protein S2
VAQDVGIKELLEAGVHFGHQTRRWNPKMRRFIYGERAGNYIIDLTRTEQLLGQAQRFADGLARRGGTVLFVGTKKQARDGIKEIAEAAGQPYVNHRWLGGLLTNFQTISLRIKRLHDLERYESEGQLGLLPTRERLAAQADLEKLRANLGGVKNMQRVPDALFVIDLKTEAIAVREAQRLRIPIIGLVDTNCDPDGIDYVIPGNDDAIRACNVITRAIGDVILAGNRTFREEEERARQEAAEQARREAEEKARREAEEQARKEAEEAAAAEALTQGGASEAVTSPERSGDEPAGRGRSEAVEPRDAAEATVADAVQDLGRPQPEGRRAAEAGAAPQGAGAPASDATADAEVATPTEPAPAKPVEAPAEPAAKAEAPAEAAPAEPAAEAPAKTAPAEPEAAAEAPAEAAPAEAEPAPEAPAEPAPEAAPAEEKKPAKKSRSRAKKKDAEETPAEEAPADAAPTETQESK